MSKNSTAGLGGRVIFQYGKRTRGHVGTSSQRLGRGYGNARGHTDKKSRTFGDGVGIGCGDSTNSRWTSIYDHYGGIVHYRDECMVDCADRNVWEVG